MPIAVPNLNRKNDRLRFGTPIGITSESGSTSVRKLIGITPNPHIAARTRHTGCCTRRYVLIGVYLSDLPTSIQALPGLNSRGIDRSPYRRPDHIRSVGFVPLVYLWSMLCSGS